MTVYVDDMAAPFGSMILCHMVADSTEQLLAMADRIGVQRKWLQRSGTLYEHFDICITKKKLAIQAGAKAITGKELGALLLRKRRSNTGPFAKARTRLHGAAPGCLTVGWCTPVPPQTAGRRAVKPDEPEEIGS